MPLSLSTIVDGTVADAADVNQYKTAIETLAGAGWNDGSGDLDVEELSDAVKTPGVGLEYSGGDLRISAAAAGNGLTGGAGSALAVNVDGSTIEINADTLRVKDSGIAVAKMAASALSGKGNTAARPAAAKAGYLYVNTQTAAIERDTGAAFEEVTGVISAANVTDLTDGGETTLHQHASGYAPGVATNIYSDHTIGGATGVVAAALPVYEFLDGEVTGNEVKIRTLHWLDTSQIRIHLRCQAQMDVAHTPGVNTPYIRLEVIKTSDGTTVTTDVEITHEGAYGAYDVSASLTGWTAEEVLIVVSLRWSTESHGGANPTAMMRYCTIYAL
jgi:hypothetical protein